MTLTNRKKLVRNERDDCNPNHKCLICGVDISKGRHHFFCSYCWVPGLMYSEKIKEIIKKNKECDDDE